MTQVCLDLLTWLTLIPNPNANFLSLFLQTGWADGERWPRQDLRDAEITELDELPANLQALPYILLHEIYLKKAKEMETGKHGNRSNVFLGSS